MGVFHRSWLMLANEFAATVAKSAYADFAIVVAVLTAVEMKS